MTISRLVALVESANNLQAVRHEPHFKPSQLAIDNCIRAHKPAYMNRTTAEMICKTSWGKYQIMGENLYTVCKVAAPLNEFMRPDNHAAQDAAFVAFIKARGIDYTLEEIKADPEKLRRFAVRYNGSSAYMSTLKKHWG